MLQGDVPPKSSQFTRYGPVECTELRTWPFRATLAESTPDWTVIRSW